MARRALPQLPLRSISSTSPFVSRFSYTLLSTFTHKPTFTSTSAPLLSTTPPSTPTEFDEFDVHYLTKRFLEVIGAKPIKGTPNCFEIGDKDYAAAELRLQQSDPSLWALVNDGAIRFDVFDNSLIMMRTPQTLYHSAAAVELSKIIREHKNILCNNFPPSSCTWRFLKDFKNTGPSGIPLFNESFAQPDEQFRVGLDLYPGVVFEAAYGQRFGGLHGLEYKMNKLITYAPTEMNTGGVTVHGINTVLGLELGTRPRLSKYILQVEQKGDNTIVLNCMKVLNRSFLDRGGSLEIYIKEFASQEYSRANYPNLDETAKLEISFQEILRAVQSYAPLSEKIKQFHRRLPLANDQLKIIRNLPRPSPPINRKSNKSSNRSFSTFSASLNVNTNFKLNSGTSQTKPYIFSEPLLHGSNPRPWSRFRVTTFAGTAGTTTSRRFLPMMRLLR